MKTLKLLTVALITVSLYACATTGEKDKTNGTGTSGSDDQNAQTSGLGSDAGFAGSAAEQKKLLEQKSVLFDFDQTDVAANYMDMLRAHAQYLQQHPDQVVLIAGNTDVRGSREYNMGLGERRASSVLNVLMANGVKGSQLIKVSYGPEVPAACGQNDAAYAQNRRVDIMYCQSKDCSTVAKNYARQALCSNPS